MKNLLIIATLISFILLTNCGSEGVGFNVGKEVSASIPVELPFSSIPFNPEDIAPFWQEIDFNPDGYTESTEYDLSEMVSGDDLDFLDAVIVNSISYEISGISAAEEINLDEIRITYTNLSNNSLLGEIVLTSRLEDVSKTEANFNYVALTDALANKATIKAEFYIDFATLPSADINFDFNFFFDVTAKIRQ